MRLRLQSCLVLFGSHSNSARDRKNLPRGAYLLMRRSLRSERSAPLNFFFTYRYHVTIGLRCCGFSAEECGNATIVHVDRPRRRLNHVNGCGFLVGMFDHALYHVTIVCESVRKCGPVLTPVTIGTATGLNGCGFHVGMTTH